MVTCRLYDRQDRSRWDDFVAGSKNGTFLFRRDYMEYHEDRVVDASVIVLDEAETWLALFPANRSGNRVISHGGLSYGGMVSSDAMTTSRALDIMAAWLRFWQASGIEEVIYKAVPPIYHRVPADEDRYALFALGAALHRREVLAVVDLARPVPMQERRRRGAKKAARSGLTVRESTDLEGFWQVLEGNLAERHAVRPVHSLAEMRLLQAQCPGNIRLLAVLEGERVCAGTLLYCAGEVIHAQYIAADEGARNAGALDLLFATALTHFQGQARYFDFGNSNEDEGRTLNRGLSEFKEGFGARAICHDFYRLRLVP